MLGPMVTACGGYLPMISGRGLGYTSSTLDKLEAISGFVIFLDDERFRQIIKEVGVAIIGQISSLAPADKRFYATRDITATLDSIPLITASILAKKLAEGLDALMNVKVGSGAFMPTFGASLDLAQAIIGVANGARGLRHHRAAYRYELGARLQRRRHAGSARSSALPYLRAAQPAPAGGDAGAMQRNADLRQAGGQRRRGARPAAAGTG